MRAIVVAAVVAIAATLVLAFNVLDVLDLPAGDAALRLLPARPAAHSVVVAIDESSLRGDLGAWPWKRETLARLVDRAADAGARAVIFDILLPEHREGDETLARSMR